jgi:hypothetical protein
MIDPDDGVEHVHVTHVETTQSFWNIQLNAIQTRAEQFGYAGLPGIYALLIYVTRMLQQYGLNPDQIANAARDAAMPINTGVE